MSTPESPAPLPPSDSGPDAIRRQFAPVAAATDTPPPGDGSRLPAVNLSTPISVLSRTVGMICAGVPIFRFGEGIVTVDESGRITGMTAERFTSWIESHLAFTSPTKDDPKVVSIGKDLAAKILAADQFKTQLRELKAVSAVRVPLWRGEGTARRVELSPEGFDPATGLFTVNSVPFQDDWSEDAAGSFLWQCLKEFPYDPEGESKAYLRRSFSAQIAVMVGIFCHSLFPEGTPRPLIIYNANQPGSGKSLLMRVALAPVHGPPPETGKPETEAEFEKVLDSAAIARKPFLVLDDCKSIHSQALNRFVTSPVHECRLMHSQRMAVIPKVTQVLATGNGLTISEDLDRRALVVDLFEPGEAATRTFKNEITPAWLFMLETRAKFLAALWAFVRTWQDKGRPLLGQHRRGSFEDWSGIIGGIVEANGLANPFAPRQAASGGDEAGRALRQVIGRIVGESVGDTLVLSTDMILDRATAEDLMEVIVGFTKDPKKSLGWKLKALRGRHLQDSRGRMFEFGRRGGAAGAGYPVRFLEG